ncbi:MAG: hypothetical protein ACREJD_08060 [Phycisphaerales bacterium]
MANVSPTVPTFTGVAPVSTAPTVTVGDFFDNPRGDLMVRVNNASGGSVNATVVAQITGRPGDGTFAPSTIANNVVAVPAGTARVIGPIPTAFNDVNFRTNLIISSVASVTIEAYRVAT